MVPHTDDGRVLFAVPWHDCVIVGTTDTPINKVDVEPVPLQEEIDFLITHAARYLTKDPTPKDVLSVFAGIRPLVKSADDADTAALIERPFNIYFTIRFIDYCREANGQPIEKWLKMLSMKQPHSED